MRIKGVRSVHGESPARSGSQGDEAHHAGAKARRHAGADAAGPRVSTKPVQDGSKCSSTDCDVAAVREVPALDSQRAVLAQQRGQGPRNGSRLNPTDPADGGEVGTGRQEAKAEVHRDGHRRCERHRRRSLDLHDPGRPARTRTLATIAATVARELIPVVSRTAAFAATGFTANVGTTAARSVRLGDRRAARGGTSR